MVQQELHRFDIAGGSGKTKNRYTLDVSFDVRAMQQKNLQAKRITSPADIREHRAVGIYTIGEQDIDERRVTAIAYASQNPLALRSLREEEGSIIQPTFCADPLQQEIEITFALRKDSA
jgi:hypothetical protein